MSLLWLEKVFFLGKRGIRQRPGFGHFLRPGAQFQIFKSSLRTLSFDQHRDTGWWGGTLDVLPVNPLLRQSQWSPPVALFPGAVQRPAEQGKVVWSRLLTSGSHSHLIVILCLRSFLLASFPWPRITLPHLDSFFLYAHRSSTSAAWQVCRCLWQLGGFWSSVMSVFAHCLRICAKLCSPHLPFF